MHTRVQTMPDSPAPALGAPGFSRPVPCAGLRIGVAHSLAEVQAAWTLVYHALRRCQAIPPNPAALHTLPQALRDSTCVLTSGIGGLVISTLTVIPDSTPDSNPSSSPTPTSPAPLPADAVFPTLTQRLRAEGRRLMEVTLFADRRRQLTRSGESMFEMMRLAFHYGLHTGRSDVLLRTPARLARFYARSLGFRPIGLPAPAPAGAEPGETRLLIADMAAALREQPRHPMVDFFLSKPVDPELFNRRFRFSPAALKASPLASFLPHPAPALT